MKWLRYKDKERLKFGILKDDVTAEEINGSPFGEFQRTGNKLRLNELKLLPPCSPGKVIALGLNYRDHAEETKMPLPSEPCLFMKPASAVIGPNDEIVYPSMAKRLDYEAELAIVIKNAIKDIEPDEALKHIFGYTCLNDVTARDLQKKDGQWTRSKSFDTFCPIGPYIVDGIDPDNLKIELYLNGECKQSSSTKNLIFKTAYVVSFVSKVMTLFPQDIITTGTSSGIGPMQPGDIVEVRIENIGTLRNRVVTKTKN
ncbi:MAG: fumarylacetoacetate hydrolase family protein [Candidatus Omnitrophica bacterium]|nr:fumarylacetoacetate hydrolase family protein [Candidatus Omnitrophota bacterium]